MYDQLKLILSIFLGILLVYGAISFVIFEVEEKNHAAMLYDNHYFISREVSRIIEDTGVSVTMFRQIGLKLMQEHELEPALDHSLIATSEGQPILGNGRLYDKLKNQSAHQQMIVSFLPNGWILLTQLSHEVYSRNLNRNSWLLIFSLCILIGVSLTLYRIIRSILARPLEKLTRVTHSLVQGDGMVEDFKISANSEMRVLAQEIFALREKLESVSIASKRFEDILSVSYLEKMDIGEFARSVLEALSGFIDSEELHLYIYDDEEIEAKYSYPERPVTESYTELEVNLASPGEMEDGEQRFLGVRHDSYLFPLQTPKQFLGYLLIRFPAGQRVQPKDREIIRFVRTRLIYAIINTRHFERLKAEKEKVHIHSSKMELMVILANELREFVNLSDLYLAVCQKICDYFGFNMAFLLRYQEQQNGYRCHGFFKWETEIEEDALRSILLKGQPMTGLLKEIYRTGREMRTQDIAEMLGVDREVYQEFLGEDFPREAVLLPVFRNGQVEGVLALDVTDITLDPAMMGLLKIYSQIVGEEIARLDLLQEREQYVRELEVERKRLKENIEELERTKEALASERFKRLKDNLITEFSHDMRTPLTILAGYLDLFRKNVFNEQMTEKIIRTMQEETSYLISMVENLLESAKILSDGVADRQIVEIDLGHWLERLINAHPLYRERVHLVVQEEAGVTLATDESKLTKIVTNLIDNACKYSEKQVQVGVKAGLDGLVVSVQDQGIGIEAQVLHCIFRKFYRVKNANTRGTRGSGLGLFIVKEYMEQLGGKVQVYSTPGQGTTFTLHFPEVALGKAGGSERVCKENVN